MALGDKAHRLNSFRHHVSAGTSLTSICAGCATSRAANFMAGIGLPTSFFRPTVGISPVRRHRCRVVRQHGTAIKPDDGFANYKIRAVHPALTLTSSENTTGPGWAMGLYPSPNLFVRERISASRESLRTVLRHGLSGFFTNFQHTN